MNNVQEANFSDCSQSTSGVSTDCRGYRWKRSAPKKKPRCSKTHAPLPSIPTCPSTGTVKSARVFCRYTLEDIFGLDVNDELLVLVATDHPDFLVAYGDLRAGVLLYL